MADHRPEHVFSSLVRPLLIAAIALVPLAAAQAYVGPGAGLSLLGALWGLLAAVGAALLFVVLWPLRRMRRRKREQARENAAAEGAQPHQPDSPAEVDEPSRNP